MAQMLHALSMLNIYGSRIMLFNAYNADIILFFLLPSFPWFPSGQDQ